MLITAENLPSKPYVAFVVTRPSDEVLASGHTSVRAAKEGMARLEARAAREYPNDSVAVSGWGIIEDAHRRYGYVI
ncbi:hypothetical protein SEA_CECE_328 [Microbacterium phage Cece]|nr:hypothetical protein SEA_CECE_26 [Microbacterium phage Cece]UVG35334.1 hypothetical protein SEA_CECE_328 [Microbacterium phage Cece]